MTQNKKAKTIKSRGQIINEAINHTSPNLHPKNGFGLFLVLMIIVVLVFLGIVSALMTVK